MITIKTEKQIADIAEGGHMLHDVIEELVAHAKPGVTTKELDQLALELVHKAGAKPAFLNYQVGDERYPATLCASVNDHVVHGIPTDRPLKEGDVLGIDMGLIHKKWNLDSAVTVIVGHNQKAEKLVSVTREAMMLGIAQAKAGNHVGDISHTVQTYVEKHGFGIVRDLVGHGIGKELHEEPRIPNFGKPGEGPQLKAGMVICIEPMVTAGDWRVTLADDGWTYRTKDGSLAAHFEHTVAITKNGPVVLT